MASENIWIGAHTSAAGGVNNALREGHEIGATTIQLFTSNQKRWESKPLTPEAIDLWQRGLQETGLQKIMSHDSYLINLGSADLDIQQKSRMAFRAEIMRCLQLDIDYLNFHPGAAVGIDPQQCLDNIVESLLSVEDLVAKSSGKKLKLILEATAGQGSNLGYRFEHLAYIISQVDRRLPIGVCLDTCHIFAAGYDIRTPEGCDSVLKEFDKVVGLPYLQAFHLNDSLKGLGSRVDRHQALGEGEIGWPCFHFLMRDKRTRHLPKYLETPGGPPLWIKEIALLKEQAQN